jgi:hypothetical protein
VYKWGDLSTKGRDLSTEGETRLWRVRLVYGGGGSSTERETRLQRARQLAVRQARVRISARHPTGGPLPSGSNEENKSGTRRV